jgi:hypothetical protein
MGYVALVTGSLLLSMCAGTYGITCPQIVNYSPEIQKQAAEELRSNDIPVTKEMIRDYLKTRDAIRVCQDYQVKTKR